MASSPAPRALHRRTAGVALAVCCSAAMLAGRAEGQGFGGQVSYTGALGPIGLQRPLCLCIYTDAQLLSGIGCLILRQNPATYTITLGLGDYYAVAFVDVHLNEQLDPDEPFQIYRGRAAPPADAVPVGPDAAHVDFTFGDENLPNAPTPTPPALPSPTSTASPSISPSPSASPSPLPSGTATGVASPTASTMPAALAGDCNGDGTVAIDELVRGVSIALEALDLEACPAVDANHDGVVTVDELIQAVSVALGR